MKILAAFVFALSLGTVTGCKHGDPAACKTSAKDSDECKSCCNKAGVTGYMWNGLSNTCTCM